LRQDLRLDDNPALSAAVQHGGPVIPVFIWAPEDDGSWSPGGANRWWLHQSLRRLEAALQQRGSRLVIRSGNSASTLQALIRDTGANTVWWNHRYEPAAMALESSLTTALQGQGVAVNTFHGGLLFAPGQVQNKEGKPFQVFTPFWKACLALPAPSEPLPEPAHIPAPDVWPDSLPLPQLGLEPRIDWADGIRAAWQPGAQGVAAQLERFLDEALTAYADDRNRPDLQGSSQLSPSLHCGEISPRRLWHQVQKHALLERQGGMTRSAEAYLRQLGWREFAYHLLYHFPHTADQPLRQEFVDFPWRDDPEALRAWQRGATGYPLVDAGMRQLWTTGWMHNRVRMVVASFLVKDLLLSWHAGAQWFWDTLVDADLANNTLGWQWTAGCGADAAPFFRLFNPVLQGQKFDPHGHYVRQWVPELAALPDTYIHRPWETPAAVLTAAHVEIGRTYPLPIVEHHLARQRALAAFDRLGKPSKASSRR
jgi:deoxyribodipyrimidine photo-lyase